MSVDLRTTLNACDSATGFSGDGPTPAVNTLTGQRYQGSGSIESQHTNADEHMYTTSIGGTRDLSAATVYWLLKDNLVGTFANGGIQGVLGDATPDRVGYDMAGNNAPGFALTPFYRGYKLDVSVVVAAPGTFNAYTGTEANLVQSATTSVGIGTIHLAKAQGNVPNIFLDRMSFHLNANYALRINAGTVGTPITPATVQADDVTNGWGLVNESIPGIYGLHGSTEWGNPTATADSYFTASNLTMVFIGDNSGGKAVAVGNFKHRLISNATDTQSFVLDSIVLLNTGSRAPFDFSDANFDIVQLTGCTFTNWGPLNFALHVATDKLLNACNFNNCDQIDLSTMAAVGCIFNGTTDADGAILLDTTLQTANQTGLIFNSDGAGHAIEITAPGTYNLSGWLFNGYSGTPGSNPTPSTGSTDAAVYNNSGGAVTINVSGGGDSPAVRNAASSTTVVNANVDVTLTGLKDNTEVRVLDNITGEFLDGVEDATTGTTDDRSFTFSLGAGVIVDIAIFNINWILPPNNRIENFTIPSGDTSIPIAQVIDRNFSNPV